MNYIKLIKSAILKRELINIDWVIPLQKLVEADEKRKIARSVAQRKYNQKHQSQYKASQRNYLINRRSVYWKKKVFEQILKHNFSTSPITKYNFSDPTNIKIE